MNVHIVEPPRSTGELRAELGRQLAEVEESLAALSIDEFFAPQGSFWSPAEHLRHLVKCVRPLARALAMPKLLLLLRFGPRLGRQRAYAEIRERYSGKLAAGATAGNFAPSSRVPDLTPEEWRRQIFDHWHQAARGLEAGLEGWSETALDRLRLEHPLLGRMTVREMLLWTLYHNQRHLQRIAERRQRPVPATGS